MKSRSRKSAAAIAAVALLLAACGGDDAADYPSGPIELSIPHPAGGGTDTVNRLLEPFLAEELGVRVDVTDRSGGAGAIAVQHITSRPADGMTILAIEGGVATTGPAGNPDLPYDPTDFVPVARMTNAAWVMIATKASGITTLAEFVAATNRPEGIRVGIAGVMSSDHYGLLLMESGLNVAGIRYVAYGGGGPKRQAIYAGEVEVILDTAASIDETLVTPLAVFASERLGLFPDIPTTAEQGFPDALSALWNGIAVHKDTPEPIIERLAAAIFAAASRPEYLQRLNDIGLEPAPMARAEFVAFVNSERAQAAALVDRIEREQMEFVG